MPSYDSKRVKTTGRGEIEFAQDDNTTDLETNAVAPHADVDSVTAINIGTGHGLFAGTNGREHTVLEFKTIMAGAGISLSDNGSTITITNTGGGGGGGGPGIADGFELILGDIATKGDGSWLPGAVALTNATKVSDAVDSINEVLGKLVPTGPLDFPGAAITVANMSGNTPLLAAGFNDLTNGGHSLVAGSPALRIVDAGVTTNTLQDVGPASSGTLTLLTNDVALTGAVVNLTGENDAGTYAGLRVADQKDFPVSTPGFWKSMDVSAFLAPVQVGLNRIKITHNGAGSTNDLVFVRDSLTQVPVVGSVVVTQVSTGALVYSSGIPHYGNGGKLSVAGTMTNIAGQTYYGGNDPVVVTGGAALSVQSFTYAVVGVTTPVAVNSLTSTAITPVEVNVDGNTHGQGVVALSARNVNGLSNPATETVQTKILVKRGVAGAGKVDELSIPVTGLGALPNNNNATRVGLTGLDRPSGAVTVWDHTVNAATAEALVVAGALTHDKTNYSTGYLPAGPNMSVGRDGAQYFTCEFQRSAVSTFKINVTGTYAGCWVRLPGVTDNPSISPNATGGWLDASKAYDGAGVPGEGGDTLAGCAQGALMAGASGSYTMTFGPQTSTNANGNRIQVRIRLNAGQAITALSFSN